MLGGSLEENILTALAWHDALAPHIAVSVKPAEFSIQVYRRIATAAVEFLHHHGRPAKVHIGDILEHDIRRGPDGRFMTIVLEQMASLAPNLNEDYVRASLDRFVETQRLVQAVNTASDLLQQDELEQAREVLRTPNLLVRDEPGVWLRDGEAWLGFLDDGDDRDELTVGIAALDHRGVRPARGEMLVLLAESGKGKSWFLHNVGKHNVLRGRNVLHLSLENSLNVTLMRYTQCFLALRRDEAKRLDLGRFEDLDDTDPQWRRVRSDPSRVRWEPHPGARLFQAVKELGKPELLRRLQPFQSRGQLLVKHFATGTLTLGMLTAYLDSLAQSEDFTPDVVLLDMLGLMHLDARELRISMGQLGKNLRGLAGLRDVALVTAVQANRDAADRQWVNASHVAEDWSLFGTADTFLTYCQTRHERGLGVARVFVEKARNATDKWTAYVEQAYDIGQFCVNSTIMTAPLQEQIAEHSGGPALSAQ